MEQVIKVDDIESIVIEPGYINIRLYNEESLTVAHHLSYNELNQFKDVIQTFRIIHQIPSQLHASKADEPVRFLDIPYEKNRRKFWSNWSWLNAMLWAIICILNLFIHKSSAILNFDLTITVIFLIAGLISYFGEDRKFFEVGIAGIRFRRPFHKIEQYSWTKIKNFEIEPGQIIICLGSSEQIYYPHSLSEYQLQEFREVIHRIMTSGFFIGKTAS